MLVQQNINLAADLVLTPRSGFDFQLACKIVGVVLCLLLLRSALTGLALSHGLFKLNRLTRDHARSVRILSDYERNYYVVNQTEEVGQVLGSGVGCIGRVYYVLRGLAQHKLPGAKLDVIKISQNGAELSGVSEDADIALRLIALLKENLSSVVNFDRTDIRYMDGGKVFFFLGTSDVEENQDGEKNTVPAARVKKR